MSKPTELKYARLHETTIVFVPNVGNLSKELVVGGVSKISGLRLEDNTVSCDTKDKHGNPVTILIPFTNFSNVVAKG